MTLDTHNKYFRYVNWYQLFYDDESHHECCIYDIRDIAYNTKEDISWTNAVNIVPSSDPLYIQSMPDAYEARIATLITLCEHIKSIEDMFVKKIGS